MPAFKLHSLGPVVEAILFEEFLTGKQNWIPDWQIKLLAKQKRNLVEKEDSFRRVADDLARLGKIKKLQGKAMYKCRHCSDSTFCVVAKRGSRE